MNDRSYQKGILCTDKCKYARYIEEGDFICAITKNVTIVKFCPMECQYPNKWNVSRKKIVSEDRRMCEEALKICEKCREKQKEEHPQSVNCAFLNDNMHCDRLEDINTLIEKLFERR